MRFIFESMNMKNICNIFQQSMDEVIYLKTKGNGEICKNNQSPAVPTTSHKMSNHNLQEDTFKVVSYKRKKLKFNSHLDVKIEEEPVGYEIFDLESTIKRISNAKEELLTSDLYSSIVASLREGLTILSDPKIEEIVCFGLGKIGDCTIARYQLALLLCLRDLYSVKVVVYDPIFNDDDCKIIDNFGLELLDHNVEGKYSIKNSNTTLFYLPHCSKQLTNNLLWSNWGLQLNRCVIVSNSFSKVIESNSCSEILRHAKYIYNCSSRYVELAIINTFKYYEIFNDTAIHIFPLENLRFVPQEIWLNNSEPTYVSDDIEFIGNKLTKVL